VKSAPIKRAARMTAPLVALVIACTFVMVPVRADTESELAKAKARLRELYGRIEAQRGEVQSLQSQASDIAAQIWDVEGRIAQVQARIVHKKRQLRQAEEDVQAAQEQLDRRAWVAYENGPGDGLEFLLGSTSLSDLSLRLEIVNRVAESDRDLIDKIQDFQERLRRRASELQNLQKRQRADLNELRAQEELLEGKLAQAQLVMNSLNADIAEATRIVDKLKDKLERERLAALLAARRGGIAGVLLVCPVDPVPAYSDDFGAPRVGHRHAGNDIFAPEGTPIRAPFDGVAADSSGGLGGYAVKVFGSKGWVYNAHLVQPPHNLGPVSTGEIIGYVGKTGNAQHTSPHNHFEWHPNVVPKDLHVSPWGYGKIGSAIDPYPYLNAVCR
jgi:peptidoglycan hydrolase CwlO-like protein